MTADAIVRLGDVELPAEVLEGAIEQHRGFIGQAEAPDHALVFDFGAPSPRLIHMLGVRTPLEVVFVSDQTVTRVETLRPWVGLAAESAEVVVEVAAGVGVEEGDRFEVSNRE